MRRVTVNSKGWGIKYKGRLYIKQGKKMRDKLLRVRIISYTVWVTSCKQRSFKKIRDGESSD